MPQTFNVETLISELELDKEDIVELLGDFREFLIEIIDPLEQAVMSGNIEESRSLSHSLKGSAGNLRVQQVYETAKKMQDAADQSDAATLKTLFAQIKVEAEDFIAESADLSSL